MIPITHMYSSWVTIWSILFICDITKVNPLFSLILCFTIGIYLVTIYYKTIPVINLLLINVFKLLLISITLCKKEEYDFVSFICSFTIYNIYLYLYNKNIHEIYFVDILNDKDLQNDSFLEFANKKIQTLLELIN